MTLAISYFEMTDEQRLRACWADFCDADPVPVEFPDDMERAGFIEMATADTDDVNSGFAWERGIEEGGPIWRLTDAGRAALAQRDEQ